MLLKPGVFIKNIRPQTTHGMMVAELIHKQLFGSDITITSISDGKHAANSLHYKGLAFDARTRDLSEEDAKMFASQLRGALGSDYDVVLEQSHCHIEYDPK